MASFPSPRRAKVTSSKKRSPWISGRARYAPVASAAAPALRRAAAPDRQWLRSSACQCRPPETVAPPGSREHGVGEEVVKVGAFGETWVVSMKITMAPMMPISIDEDRPTAEVAVSVSTGVAAAAQPRGAEHLALGAQRDILFTSTHTTQRSASLLVTSASLPRRERSAG